VTCAGQKERGRRSGGTGPENEYIREFV